MNGTHFAAAGGLTSLIAQALVYLTHWPLQPMDDATAMAFAGLIVIVLGGGSIGLLNLRKATPRAPQDAAASPIVPAAAPAAPVT
jgi:hypothetical protein